MAGNDPERWMDAWLALVRTHARLWDQIEHQMRGDHGLTMVRYDVLANLDLAGGQVRLSELAALLVLSPSGLSKLCDRMEEAGLLRREPDPADARASFAVISAQGRALVRKARRTHHRLLQERFASVLDERDIEHLSRIMGRIAGSLPAA